MSAFQKTVAHWRAGLAVALVATGLALSAPASVLAQEMDDYTRASLSYELTLPKVEAYAKALEDMGGWARKNPADAQRMRTLKPTRTLDEAVRQIENVPGLKLILNGNGLTGADMALIPLVIVSGVGGHMMEQRGIALPAGRINTSALALVRANPARMDALSQRIQTARQALSGQ